MGNKILVTAAHPDDEVLGMGGTIARHVADGSEVSVLFLGDGVSSRRTATQQNITERQHHALNACKMLGAEILDFKSFPDNNFNSVPLLDIIRCIENAKNEINPDIIYTHHGGDLNIDHRIVCQATITAFRPQPSETFTEIRCFEVNSSTEWGGIGGLSTFRPDTYVDISPYIETLLSAANCYKDEMRLEPHARSIESIKISALKRGREIGVNASEAFMTIRRIIR